MLGMKRRKVKSTNVAIVLFVLLTAGFVFASATWTALRAQDEEDKSIFED